MDASKRDATSAAGVSVVGLAASVPGLPEKHSEGDIWTCHKVGAGKAGAYGRLRALLMILPLVKQERVVACLHSS